ncbi:SGNH/GDSL hydrolase family protein [Phocaeicola sp.]
MERVLDYGSKPEVAFIGNSHIAYWPLEMYFPNWECKNYGIPGEGIDYVEAFDKDVSGCYAVVQFGTNDIYRLNNDNMDAYAERYVKAVRAIHAVKVLLFCIFPRNDYADSTAVNRFIARLNEKIKKKVELTDIVYLDVFDQLTLDGRLNPEMTIDDVHLTGAGYRVLANALRTFMKREML